MREVRAVALSLLVLLGALAVAAPGEAAGSGGPPGVAGEPATVEEPAANDTAMGDKVSSFMHASSGGTDEEVRSGMWNAAYESASNRSAVVDDRTRDIESRLDRLEAEKRELVAARENGTIGEAAYRARMSAVVSRMAALNRSIDETERQARASGVDGAKVDRLRERASNMSGPAVAETARTMAGGPPTDVPGAPADRGPPGHAGSSEGTEAPGNASRQGPPGNETGQGTPDDGAGEGTPGNGQGDAPGNGVGDGDRNGENAGDRDGGHLGFPVRPA